MARTRRAQPCRNGKPTSLPLSHPTFPLRTLHTQTAIVTLCSTSTPASSIQCWAPLTCCTHVRGQRCSTGHRTIRYELWPKALEGAVGLHREPSSHSSAWFSRSEWMRRRFPLSDSCVNALTRSSQTHLLTSSNSCCSWKTTVLAPGYCSQSRFCFVLWFLFCFCNTFQFCKSETWNIHKCTDFWHEYEFVHCSIFCICIVYFMCFVIVIYIVFAKINMHIRTCSCYYRYCYCMCGQKDSPIWWCYY